jgi:hypothetical protein
VSIKTRNFSPYNFISYTLGMRTNRNICVNCEDTGLSRQSRASFLACVKTDNIANPPTTRCGRMNIGIFKFGEKCRVASLLSTPDSALFIDEPTKNRYYRLTTRMWRNWQTHRLQVPAGLTPLEVRLLSSAFLAINSRGRSASTHDLTKGPIQADKYLD